MNFLGSTYAELEERIIKVLSEAYQINSKEITVRYEPDEPVSGNMAHPKMVYEYVSPAGVEYVFTISAGYSLENKTMPHSAADIVSETILSPRNFVEMTVTYNHQDRKITRNLKADIDLFNMMNRVGHHNPIDQIVATSGTALKRFSGFRGRKFLECVGEYVSYMVKRYDPQLVKSPHLA